MHLLVPHLVPDSWCGWCVIYCTTRCATV